jgi:hypothetical protein
MVCLSLNRWFQSSGAGQATWTTRFRLRQRFLRWCQCFHFLSSDIFSFLPWKINEYSIWSTSISFYMPFFVKTRNGDNEVNSDFLIFFLFWCIQSINHPKAYIVCQGPNENTIGDFWRMVWQEHSPCIIMLTKTFDFIKVGRLHDTRIRLT